MAHGQPDFSATSPKNTVYSLSDMAELAARLGSPVAFDRRGDVVFIDDFSHGLAAYFTAVSGLGASISQSSVSTRTGGFSLKLVAGSNAFCRAQIYKYLSYPIFSNLGAETSFTVEDNVNYLDFYFVIADGTKRLTPAVRYIQADKKITYYNSAGAWVDLATSVPLLEDINMFHTLKLVVDFKGKRYVRLLLDHLSYDMSSLAINEVPNATSPYMFYLFDNVGDPGTNATVYADDLIITQNEP